MRTVKHKNSTTENMTIEIKENVGIRMIGVVSSVCYATTTTHQVGQQNRTTSHLEQTDSWALRTRVARPCDSPVAPSVTRFCVSTYSFMYSGSSTSVIRYA
jgi:hypothetical protein